MAEAGVIVIGVGNELRGDDAAGIEVARRVADTALGAGIAVNECQGEPMALLDAWSGASGVVLVDTIRSGAAPGTVHRFDATRQPLPTRLAGSSSTHAVGLEEAIELGRSLGRLPEQVIVYGVEGRSFAAGAGMSAELTAALPALADAVLSEARALAG